MKILITGATGYIGKKLIERLRKEKHQIYIIVRQSSDIADIKDEVEEIIYANPYEDLYAKIRAIHPEGYINLAGYYCGVHTAEKMNLLLDGNIIFPSYVLDAVVESGCKSIVHTASYQQSYHGEYYNPINLYAATKQAFEDILSFFSTSNRIRSITLQLFDTYGIDDVRNKVFNYVRRLKNRESLDMSAGMQKLYFCYIDDVIEAYVNALKILQTKENGFYKRYAVRLLEPIELKKFIEKYLYMTQKKVNIFWGKRDYMEKEIMDPSGYGEILPDWKAKISYEEGLKLCSQYDLEHYKEI